MLSTEGLDGDTQLHALVPVGTDKLIVIKLDDIAVLVGDDLGDLDHLSGLVRKHGGYGEDTVSLDQAELYHGGHGDDVHISAA